MPPWWWPVSYIASVGYGSNAVAMEVREVFEMLDVALVAV